MTSLLATVEGVVVLAAQCKMSPKWEVQPALTACRPTFVMLFGLHALGAPVLPSIPVAIDVDSRHTSDFNSTYGEVAPAHDTVPAHVVVSARSGVQDRAVLISSL